MTRLQKKRLGIVSGAVICAIAAIACTLHLSLGDGDRRTVAGELVTDVIIPTYAEVVERTAQLQTAAATFAATPVEANLTALRDSWRRARLPWKETDAFRFGPMAMQSLGVAMDQVPVDPPKIEMEIAGTATLDATYVANIGANRKGFHALEYLIFDSANIGDVALLANLAADTRRRDFIASAAADIARNALALHDAWVEYSARLADPGADNADYPTIKASIDALVNETVFQAEVIADARIGKPFGTANGGTPDPGLQESGPSGTSVTDMTSTLRGIRNIYYGSRDGMLVGGISALLAAQSPAVDRSVREAIETAFAALAEIPMPYTQALVDRDPRVMTAYTAVQDLQHILATEVISTLGATLKFNDNDGD